MAFYGSERIQQILNYLKTYLTEKFAAKQDKLTFDAVPTENSMNVARSSGIYSALESKANTSDLPDESKLVHTVGTESIGGAKKFTSSAEFNYLRSLDNNDPNFYIGDLGISYRCNGLISYGGRYFDVEIMQAPNQLDRNPSKGYAITYSGGTDEHPTEAWLLVDSTKYDESAELGRNRVEKGGILYIARTAFLEPPQGSYQRRGVVDDNYTIKINTDTKAVDFSGDVDVAGNVNVTGTLKKGGANVSLAGHTHSVSDITNMPSLTWTRIGVTTASWDKNYSSGPGTISCNAGNFSTLLNYRELRIYIKFYWSNTTVYHFEQYINTDVLEELSYNIIGMPRRITDNIEYEPGVRIYRNPTDSQHPATLDLMNFYVTDPYQFPTRTDLLRYVPDTNVKYTMVVSLYGR